MNKLEKLSKEVSYALRHAPWEYELEMDEEGWVPVEQLLDALHREEKWKSITETDLNEMIEKSEKKRHEVKAGKIRAFYGHSIPMKILKEEKMPPAILYHGTARRFLQSIKENGLLPQSRQYVHLSQDIETAENVGKRHDDKPCILVIDAKKAWSEGIKFYLGNEKVWLADKVPAKYLVIPEHLASTYNMLKNAFPNGMTEETYHIIISLLYDEMSDRNLAEVLFYLTNVDEEIILNDIYKVATMDLDRDKCNQVKRQLEEYGYRKWIENE